MFTSIYEDKALTLSMYTVCLLTYFLFAVTQIQFSTGHFLHGGRFVFIIKETFIANQSKSSLTRCCFDCIRKVSSYLGE